MIEELKRLLSEATPERPTPWAVEVDGDDLAYIDDQRGANVSLIHDYPHVAALITAAVNALPQLLAVVEVARQAAERGDLTPAELATLRELEATP